MTNATRAYALTMTKPHERLGMAQPFVRQLAQNTPLLWEALIWTMIFGFALTYIGFITASSARGFQLRDAEQRLERLQSEARALEMDVARVSSIDAMANRAEDLGFVAVKQIDAVDVSHSYALAR